MIPTDAVIKLVSTMTGTDPNRLEVMGRSSVKKKDLVGIWLPDVIDRSRMLRVPQSGRESRDVRGGSANGRDCQSFHPESGRQIYGDSQERR
jgi:hypothetical protein